MIDLPLKFRAPGFRRVGGLMVHSRNVFVEIDGENVKGMSEVAIHDTLGGKRVAVLTPSRSFYWSEEKKLQESKGKVFELVVRDVEDNAVGTVAFLVAEASRDKVSREWRLAGAPLEAGEVP